MTYRLLADAALILHLLFILFVVCGGLIVRRWARLALLHLPAVGWGAFIEVSGRLCPLTDLEVEFLRAVGEAGYSGGFIEYYLVPIIYPPGLTRGIQFCLAGAVILVNVLVYGSLLYRQRQPRAQDSRQPLS